MSQIIFQFVNDCLIVPLSTATDVIIDSKIFYECAAAIEPILGNVYITPPQLKQLEQLIMRMNTNNDKRYL